MGKVAKKEVAEESKPKLTKEQKLAK